MRSTLLVALLATGCTFEEAQLSRSDLANDKATQANVDLAARVAKGCFSDNGTFAGCDFATLQDLEASITFVSGPSDSSSTVSVAVGSDGGSIQLAALSPTGICWSVIDDGSAYGTAFASEKGSGCTAGVNATDYHGGW